MKIQLTIRLDEHLISKFRLIEKEKSVRFAKLIEMAMHQFQFDESSQRLIKTPEAPSSPPTQSASRSVSDIIASELYKG